MSADPIDYGNVATRALEALHDRMAPGAYRDAVRQAIDEIKGTNADIERYHHLPQIGEHWRHVKRGSTYHIVCVATMQSSQRAWDHEITVVYRSNDDGRSWVRTLDEFMDGRFVRVHASKGGEA